MIIKNYMEDYVSNLVKFVLKQRKENLGEKGRYDVMAYVLNRSKPRYVVSSRGQIHTMRDLSFSFQERADILQLIFKAINIVKARRKTDSTNIPLKSVEQDKPYFIFPVLVGRVFDENVFPAVGAKVTLLINAKRMEMINPSWPNPYVLNKGSREYFNFLAKPIPAQRVGETQTFHLEVLISLKGFKNLVHKITLSMKSIVMIEGIGLFNEVKDIGTFVIERAKEAT